MIRKKTILILLTLLTINLYSINVDDFLTLLEKYNVRFPYIVTSQAVVESAYFTSDVYKNTNNPFGMKHPYIRETNSIKPYGFLGYATYTNIDSSITDYKYRVHEFKGDTCSSPEEYLEFLGNSNYAEASYYTALIKEIAIKLIIKTNTIDGVYMK